MYHYITLSLHFPRSITGFGIILWVVQPVAFHSFHFHHSPPPFHSPWQELCQSPEPCYPQLLLLVVLVDEDCPHISEGDVKEKNCFLLINYYHMKWLLWWLCFVIVLKSWVNNWIINIFPNGNYILWVSWLSSPVKTYLKGLFFLISSLAPSPESFPWDQWYVILPCNYSKIYFRSVGSAVRII